MSLMFPTIYGIALRGLGSEVKLGAAGLIMAILGGAVITPYMGSFIDNTTVKNQVAYFESIDRPLIAQAEAADSRKSVSGAMLALYKMSEANPAGGEEQAKAAAKFQKNLDTFLSLHTLDGEAFDQAAKSLPGCSGLKPEELVVSRPTWTACPPPPGENSKSAILPDSGAHHALREPGRGTWQPDFRPPGHEAIPDSPGKLCGKSGAVILLYSHHLLCRGTNLRLLLPQHPFEKGRGRACPGLNQLHITYARYENSITNHRYPPHD